MRRNTNIHEHKSEREVSQVCNEHGTGQKRDSFIFVPARLVRPITIILLLSSIKFGLAEELK